MLLSLIWCTWPPVSSISVEVVIPCWPSAAEFVTIHLMIQWLMLQHRCLPWKWSGVSLQCCCAIHGNIILWLCFIISLLLYPSICDIIHLCLGSQAKLPHHYFHDYGPSSYFFSNLGLFVCRNFWQAIHTLEIWLVILIDFITKYFIILARISC